ncbi:MAG: sn-glycerol-3-phosphate ABC transporter ATP-binding protein UgpC [Sedimentisphaerales bacterium]|nr:sn-glycerol-3-phosphate ABC transporter ATP-binding protein UgpC [Sedimentisphaerales bacterium]
MARVLLNNISKVFDNKVTAVSDFSLEITDGEFMVIVGPSGCGKTTTLRMIAGLEKPTSGNIHIGDTLVDDCPARDRDVAMVFQNYALYPHMSVCQNMAFALKMRKVPPNRIRERVKHAAHLLGIEQLMDRRPAALSGGQRQRAALGRAIVRDPKVFLYDEPLSNLDARLRVSTRFELKAIHHRLRTTSVYVTHDQVEAMTLGDRICVMYDGRVQQVADPVEVYKQPVNRFVAGFLGTPPMNFLTGRLDFRNDTACIAIGNDTIILTQRLKAILADYRNKEMVLGIRPENLSAHQFPGRVDNVITAVVSALEPLGAAIYAYLTCGTGEKFIVNVDPHLELKIDETVIMHIDSEHIHIFEPGDTGKNITFQS